MDKDWENRLLAASKRETEDEENEFLSLVDQAADKVDLNTAKILLKTYSAKLDYGTQERVESVLATGDERIIVRAVLEEMPRLVSEASEWAEALLGHEIEHRVSLVQETLKSMSPQVKKAVSQLVDSNDYLSFYPGAHLLSERGA